MHEVPLAMSMKTVSNFVHFILTRLVERHLLQKEPKECHFAIKAED